MPSEMLSGPDLGGGFLHQLSLDREEGNTFFTFHAQDGGSDAGGPPPGPLDVFGYSHPTNPCQFGGPRCWHRRFRLPFEAVPRVRQAYNRGRFVLETMVAQAYLGAPAGIEAALAEIVRRLPASDATTPPDWYVGSSTAAWILGAARRPRDIDLGVSRAGVDHIGEALVDFLIEPVAATDWPPGRIVRAGRAFVGTFREGARVEWAISLEPQPSGAPSEWSDANGPVRLLPVEFRGHPLRVSRPEYALVRAALAEDPVRFAELAGLVRRIGPDRDLLDGLLSDPPVPRRVREAVSRHLS